MRKILAISVLSNAAVFGPGLGADCNKNGVDDIAEVRSGQSPDCNRNGVPDDCDLRPVNPGLDLSGEISTEGLYEPWEMRFADMDSDGDLDLLGTSHFSPVLLVMVEYCPHQDEQGEYKAEKSETLSVAHKMIASICCFCDLRALFAWGENPYWPGLAAPRD